MFHPTPPAPFPSTDHHQRHAARPLAPRSSDYLTVAKLPAGVPPEGWVVSGLHYGDTRPVNESKYCRTPDDVARTVKEWAMSHEGWATAPLPK